MLWHWVLSHFHLPENPGCPELEKLLYAWTFCLILLSNNSNRLSPKRKTHQGLVLLFSIDTAKGSIMGLLWTTCIMLNSSGWYRSASLFSSLPHTWDTKKQLLTGKKKKRRLAKVPCVRPGTQTTGDPLVSLRWRCKAGDRDRRRGERTHVIQSKWSASWLSL